MFSVGLFFFFFFYDGFILNFCHNFVSAADTGVSDLMMDSLPLVFMISAHVF